MAVQPNWYDVKADGGATGNGSTPDTTAFQNAASSGKPIYIPYGTYLLDDVINIAQDVIGDGCDTGQSIIKLDTDGKLATADSDMHWRGFKIESDVNNLTFVEVAHHNFRFDNFIMEGLDSASGQVGIELVANSPANLSHCVIERFRIVHVSYPVVVSGDGHFINNTLGRDSDFWHDFASAIRIENTGVWGLNHVGGYFEDGTNCVYNDGSSTDTHFRHNTFDVHMDDVTNMLNTSKNIGIDYASLWNVPRQEATIVLSGGATYCGPQKFLSKPAVFRAYRGSSDQALTDNTETKVQWNAETLDTLGQFDISTNYRYTAPYSQYMEFTTQVEVTTNLAAGDRVDLKVKKNGSTEIAATKGWCQGSNGIVLTLSDKVRLEKNDYLEVFVTANEQAGANTHYVSNSSTMCYFHGKEIQ